MKHSPFESQDSSLEPQNLFVVLPAYNEGESLSTLIQQFQQAVTCCPFQIILVDDGSTDHSIKALEAQSFNNLDIIRHQTNKGLGEAIKTGFLIALERATDQDLIVVMDSDCTHSPYLVNRMVELVQEGNDVVIASRYRYGSRVVGLSPLRELLSHGASWFFRLTVPIPNVKDYTCGFRVYRVGTLRHAFDHYKESFITESGFACMADILIKLHRVGALCCEVPMILRYDQKVSTSKIKIFRTILNSFKLAGKHFLKARR